MNQDALVLLIYIIFVWMVVLHTFEEIACDIFELQVGQVHLTKNRYLLVAGGISTVNMGVLVLLVLGLPIGYYLGLLTSAVLGVLQGLVHTVGYFRAGRKMRGYGAGFYSAIPLSFAGAATFVILLLRIF